MEPSTHTVLKEVVDRNRESGEPVRSRAVAESLGVTESAVTEPLDTLCEFELLESSERGFRPTVTAQELLALDIDLEETVALDFVEE
jgi:predicted transcriptional regulator